MRRRITRDSKGNPIRFELVDKSGNLIPVDRKHHRFYRNIEIREYNENSLNTKYAYIDEKGNFIDGKKFSYDKRENITEKINLSDFETPLVEDGYIGCWYKYDNENLLIDTGVISESGEYLKLSNDEATQKEIIEDERKDRSNLKKQIKEGKKRLGIDGFTEVELSKDPELSRRFAVVIATVIRNENNGYR